MFWIKIVKSFFSILHSNISPKQISGGVALGSIIGLTPISSLHNVVVLLLIYFLNVNISAATLSAGLFAILAYLADPLAHKIGYQLLVKTDALIPLWTRLYNMPIVPFTHFYNTIVLGSLIISLVLFIPLFIATNKFISFYRKNLKMKIENTKFMKLFKLTSIYNLYDKTRSED